MERTRDYTKEALNDLFEAMDGIERRHELIPKFTDAQEAEIAAADEKLGRGERLPELEHRSSTDEYLLESEETVLGRLHALPQDEQDHIRSMIRLLIEIDAPPLQFAPAQIAKLRRSLRHLSGE